MDSAPSSPSAPLPLSSLPPVGAALLYEDGEWINIDDDPIDERHLIGLHLPAIVKNMGYVLFTIVRHQDSAPLGLSLYRGPRTAALRWIVVLEAPPCQEGLSPQYTYVYARRVADVMSLLGRWAPVIHGLAAAELAASVIAEAEDETSGGVTKTLGLASSSPDVFRLIEDGREPGAPAAAGPDRRE